MTVTLLSSFRGHQATAIGVFAMPTQSSCGASILKTLGRLRGTVDSSNHVCRSTSLLASKPLRVAPLLASCPPSLSGEPPSSMGYNARIPGLHARAPGLQATDLGLHARTPGL